MKTILFMISQNLSLFGSSVTAYAVIWYITLETSSGKWMTAAAICQILPEVIVSVWGGVWADRHSRKMLIMVSDTFIALCTLLLAAAFAAGFRHMSLLMVVLAVRSAGTGIQSPAVNAVYPQITGKDSLTRAQGINQTLRSALSLVSPAAGGFILGTFGIEWAFMIDVCTAALAVCIFSFISVQQTANHKSRPDILGEFKEGIAYTLSHPLLKRILICYAVSFFLFTPAAILTPLLIERTYGQEVWRLTLNESVWALGSVIGGIFVSLHGDFRRGLSIMAACIAAFGFCFSLMGIVDSFAAYILLTGLAGVFLPVISTVQIVFIQRSVEEHITGRIFAIIGIVSSSAMPAAILLFGPLADIVSVQSILTASGILLLFTSLWFWAAVRNQT